MNQTKLISPLADRLVTEYLKNEAKKKAAIFKAASPEQKRVLIAKDVIAQVKAKKYVPKRGTWQQVVMKGFDYRDDHDDKANERSLQLALIGDEVGTCECCALGSMFLSCTLFNNKVTVEQANDTNTGGVIHNRLKHENGLNRFFTNKQLVLIEIAFELGYGAFRDEIPYKFGVSATLENKAINFGFRYDNEDARLLAIMRNIVKNNGEFKP